MAERMRTYRGAKYPISPAHPAAEAFPWLDDDDLQALAADIAANGQQYKVVRLPDGRVIDGRNRELACRVAGVEPQYRTEDLDGDAVITFVVSANIHRRELTASQRAMIAAELANMRQGDNQHGEVASCEATSQADAAKLMDSSRASVQRAAKVKEKAPELVAAVRRGELDVTTAAKVADLPKKERKKVAKAKDKKKAAKDALDGAKAEPAVVPPTPADEWGIPIQPHAAEAFAAVGKFKELVAAIQAAQRLFDEVANTPGGAFLTLPEVSSYRRGKKTGESEYADRYVHEGLEQAIRQVRAAAPKHTVCPYRYADAPHPEKCRCCLGLNWTPGLSAGVPALCVERAKEAFGVKGAA